MPLARQSILVGVLAASGCFDADYGGTHLRCPPASPGCPDGFTCVAEVCTPIGAGLDGGGPDASACDLAAAAPDNDVCGAAIDLTAAALAAGGARVYGDTRGYAGDLAPSTLPGCTETVEPGPDAIYRLVLAAGDSVALTLTPFGYDAGVYVIDACSGTAACKGGDDALGSGAIDEATVAITAAGTYYVVVDASSSSGAGCYSLAVAITR